MKLILIFLFLLIVAEFTFCVDRDCLGKEVKPHSCNWAGCDYKGLTVLPALYNPIDSVHLYNPSIDYDKAELLTNK